MNISEWDENRLISQWERRNEKEIDDFDAKDVFASVEEKDLSFLM